MISDRVRSARNPPARRGFLPPIMDLAAPIPTEYDREVDWLVVQEFFERMDAAFLAADIQDGREEDYVLCVSPARGRMYAGFLMKQYRDAERLGAAIEPPEYRFRGVRVRITPGRETSTLGLMRKTA